MNKNIPPAVIRRLPRYYRYLKDLLAKGITRISSADLSIRMNVTASQIRQDLNHFGGFGQQGYGYNVEKLFEEIGKILGQDHVYRVVVVGAGNLGRAIAHYAGYDKKGYKVCALFDNSDELVGSTVRGIPIKHMSELSDYLKQEKMDIGVIATPKEGANEVAKKLIDGGVKALWNFASIDLPPEYENKVAIEDVHLSDSLRVLTYRMKELEEEIN